MWRWCGANRGNATYVLTQAGTLVTIVSGVVIGRKGLRARLRMVYTKNDQILRWLDRRFRRRGEQVVRRALGRSLFRSAPHQLRKSEYLTEYEVPKHYLWPKVKALRKVPRVDGAITRCPSTA